MHRCTHITILQYETNSINGIMHGMVYFVSLITVMSSKSVHKSETVHGITTSIPRISLLFKNTKDGFERSISLYNFNSRTRLVRSLLGSLPSFPAASTTYNNTFVRSTCFKNSCPNPLSSCAPSIRPDASAQIRQEACSSDCKII